MTDVHSIQTRSSEIIAFYLWIKDRPISLVLVSYAVAIQVSWPVNVGAWSQWSAGRSQAASLLPPCRTLSPFDGSAGCLWHIAACLTANPAVQTAFLLSSGSQLRRSTSWIFLTVIYSTLRLRLWHVPRQRQSPFLIPVSDFLYDLLDYQHVDLLTSHQQHDLTFSFNTYTDNLFAESNPLLSDFQLQTMTVTADGDSEMWTPTGLYHVCHK